MLSSTVKYNQLQYRRDGTQNILPSQIPIVACKLMFNFHLDTNQINNLLSGLFGAVIAVILTSALARLTNAAKLNRIRKTLLDYLKFIGLDKSYQYADDMLYINDMVLATDEEEIKNTRSVDAMPMFSSDIFKSFSPDELRQACFNSKNYIIAIDISYSTDFLKANMPLDIYNSYLSKVWTHYEEKGLNTHDEQVKHLKECGVLKNFARQASGGATAKLERAKATHQQIHRLIDNLNGWSFWWTIKYLWRQ